MLSRMTKIDWLLAAAIVAGSIAGTGWLFSRLGFLGIGVLGLVTGLVAVNVDLEGGWPIGYPRDNTYAGRLAAEDSMSRAERAERREERARAATPIFVAKVASAGLVILGFGLFFLVQL